MDKEKKKRKRTKMKITPTHEAFKKIKDKVFSIVPNVKKAWKMFIVMVTILLFWVGHVFQKSLSNTKLYYKITTQSMFVTMDKCIALRM